MKKMLLSKKLDNNVRKYCEEIYSDVRQKHQNVELEISWFPAVASSCCYTNTPVFHDCSKCSTGVVYDPRLVNQFRRLGGNIGAIVIGCDNTLGCCAEQHAANLLLQRTFGITRMYTLERINFSKAYRPRTMEVIPMCNNCKRIFNR